MTVSGLWQFRWVPWTSLSRRHVYQNSRDGQSARRVDRRCRQDLSKANLQVSFHHYCRDRHTVQSVPGRLVGLDKADSRLISNCGGIYRRRGPCVVYIDDSIIIAKSFDEMVVNLEEVLDRFRKSNLKLQPSKCKLFQSRVRFLSHIVSASGIECDPDKVSRITNLEFARSVSELRKIMDLGTHHLRKI